MLAGRLSRDASQTFKLTMAVCAKWASTNTPQAFPSEKTVIVRHLGGEFEGTEIVVS